MSEPRLITKTVGPSMPPDDATVRPRGGKCATLQDAALAANGVWLAGEKR